MDNDRDAGAGVTFGAGGDDDVSLFGGRMGEWRVCVGWVEERLSGGE